MKSFSLIIIFFLFSFTLVRGDETSHSCGSFGPTQWVNSHISDIMMAGVGAPFSTRVAASPHFFDFYGAEGFPGAFGCRPSKLVHYTDDSASVSYQSESPYVAEMNQDSTPEEDEEYSSFGKLQVEYEECVPHSSEEAKRTVVKRYSQTNPSYPEGVQTSFYYDDSCRVSGLEESSLVDNTISYTANFTYEGRVSWLPNLVKSQSEISTSLLRIDIQQLNNNGKITAFSTTKYTAQHAEDLAIAPPRVEEWQLFYSSQSQLERALLNRRSMLGKEAITYLFDYDNQQRWTKVSSGLTGPKKRNQFSIAARVTYSGAEMKQLRLPGGVGAIFRME